MIDRVELIEVCLNIIHDLNSGEPDDRALAPAHNYLKAARSALRYDYDRADEAEAREERGRKQMVNQ